mmetsp:Transcript_37822/g.81624  ORF Transcript_37822/g.81624 Transcript_37822/m.81624 type:complete len:342 (-) Transcript_37822:230-1255(-)
MATSLDALEALLQFREGFPKMKTGSPSESHSGRPVMPVPNPLDPAQPHVIEGDSPTHASNRLTFKHDTQPAFPSKSSMSPIVTTVPDPLAMPLVEQHSMPASIAAAKALKPTSAPNKIFNHGFMMSHPTPMHTMSCDVKPRRALTVEVPSGKILDALHSKPQRGKKRENLNDMERLELTRTRNREHAKSTRMKKKARFDELIEIEKKYLLLQEKEIICRQRRQFVVEFVENIGNSSEQSEVKNCSLSSGLMELAREEIMNPEFSVMDCVALTSENSGMVRVTAHGTDLKFGNPKTLSGVICVDFVPGTVDICDVFLYWSSPKSIPSSVGIFPSVSVLSFGP